MIGFHEQPTTDRGHPNEDPETRDLDKRKLYNMLALRHCLPPLTTKGVTRDYLCRVHKGEVYTVPLLDLKHFEVELTLQMNRRVGIPNNSLLVRKIDALLKSRRQPELGFDLYEPPDEVRVAHKDLAVPCSTLCGPSEHAAVLRVPCCSRKPDRSRQQPDPPDPLRPPEGQQALS